MESSVRPSFGARQVATMLFESEMSPGRWIAYKVTLVTPTSGW
jgi:hypothetical protein